jgi:hypothetical protein
MVHLRCARGAANPATVYRARVVGATSGLGAVLDARTRQQLPHRTLRQCTPDCAIHRKQVLLCCTRTCQRLMSEFAPKCVCVLAGWDERRRLRRRAPARPCCPDCAQRCRGRACAEYGVVSTLSLALVTSHRSSRSRGSGRAFEAKHICNERGTLISCIAINQITSSSFEIGRCAWKSSRLQKSSRAASCSTKHCLHIPTLPHPCAQTHTALDAPRECCSVQGSRLCRRPVFPRILTTSGPPRYFYLLKSIGFAPWTTLS